MPLCILATVPPQRAMKATTTMYRTGTQDRTLCFTTVAAFGLTLDCLQLRLNELWTPQSCKADFSPHRSVPETIQAVACISTSFLVFPDS